MHNDLQLDPWLKDGSRHTPTLPDLAREIAAIDPRPQRILDAGCGSGELLRLLLEHGFPRESLCGIDIEPDHAELARRRTGLGDNIALARLTDFASETAPKGVQPHTMPGLLKYDVIAAINWLQTDWPNTYAVKAARKPADPNRLDNFLDNCFNMLHTGGLLIWDWHTTSEVGFLELLDRRGWRQAREPMRFDATNYPEKYPVYFYRHPLSIKEYGD